MNEKKFDGKGEIYAQFRPSYPQECIDTLFIQHGLANAVFADIGAGTGKLTQMLLEKGNTVYAVEPNADMRKLAEETLSDFRDFLSVNGTAENTTLPARSIDCITAAQAFHWFDRTAFQKECRRILKPNGIVILLWNSRDEASPLVQENDCINRLYCPNFKGFSGGMRGARADGEFSDFFNGDYQTLQFDFPLFFNEQGFIGRNLSASYALKPTDAQYSVYVSALQTVFSKYAENGNVCMPNFTQCYIGTV